VTQYHNTFAIARKTVYHLIPGPSPNGEGCHLSKVNANRNDILNFSTPKKASVLFLNS